MSLLAYINLIALVVQVSDVNAAFVVSSSSRNPTLLCDWSTRCCTSSRLFAAGQGFGSNNNDNDKKKISVSKTYGSIARAPIMDVIDQEGAMEAFFTSREEWMPLFRTVAGTDLPADTESLINGIAKQQQQSSNIEIDFHENSTPWRRLQAIPSLEEDREVLAKFLDSMHQSLLDIPVNEVANPETADDDEDDLHFLEEGRRMLAINRFHVIRESSSGSIESVDTIFAHIWSEVMELTMSDISHTGSLILLPDYNNLSDLRRFTDMNIIRPLQWLGIYNNFEVVSMQRDSPAIRLLYKLNDMPNSDSYTEKDGFAAGS